MFLKFPDNSFRLLIFTWDKPAESGEIIFACEYEFITFKGFGQSPKLVNVQNCKRVSCSVGEDVGSLRVDLGDD